MRRTKFLFIILGLIVPAVAVNLVAAQTVNESGDIGLTGIVPGPPPTDPAVITSPTNNQRFDTAIIDVAGTCVGDVIVEIYKGSALRGSALCTSDLFDLSITLTAGKNKLVAKVRDSIGQYGPDSTPVTVYYDVPSSGEDDDDDDQGEDDDSSGNGGSTPEAPGSGGGGTSTPKPFIVSSEALTQGTHAGNVTTISYTIKGGTPPYALTVDWGDETGVELFSIKRPGTYTLQHIYKEPGQYEVIIRVVDHAGRETVVQTVVLISGENDDESTTNGNAACPQSKCTNRELLKQFIQRWWLSIPVSISFMGFLIFGGKRLGGLLARIFARRNAE